MRLFPRPLVLLMLLFAAGALANNNKSNGGLSASSLANWIVIVSAALTVFYLATSWLWWRWERTGRIFDKHHFRGVWRRFANPVSVTYLLPKRIYPDGLEFVGASDEEETPRRLIVGVGEYDLTVLVKAHTLITVEQLRVVVDANVKDNRPKSFGLVPSRFLRDAEPDYLGRPRYVDWNGEVKVAAEFMGYPQKIANGDHVLATIRLSTSGAWSGHLSVVVLIAGHFTKSQTKTLRLDVTTDPARDEVEFLRRKSVGGKVLDGELPR